MFIRLLACVTLPMLVLQACAPTIDSGKDFDEKKVAEIKLGTTSKTEIQSFFGAPTSRMRMDGKETWTYQRMTTATNATSSVASAAAAGIATSAAETAVAMIPGVGMIAPLVGAAGSMGSMYTNPQATMSMNSKILSIEFNGDLVASCRLMISRSGGKMVDALSSSDTDITTCH